jgi:hypothetical protein
VVARESIAQQQARTYIFMYTALALIDFNFQQKMPLFKFIFPSIYVTPVIGPLDGCYVGIWNTLLPLFMQRSEFYPVKLGSILVKFDACVYPLIPSSGPGSETVHRPLRSRF